MDPRTPEQSATERSTREQSTREQSTRKQSTRKQSTREQATSGQVEDRADLLLSRHLARVMDDLVTVPGTRIGIGADAVFGLVPGVGDVVGSTLSGLILTDAVRVRVPLLVLLRMAANVLLDSLLGLVPVVGDLLDVAHRANRKNLRLLEHAVAANPRAKPPTVGYLVSAVALVIGTVLAAAGLGLLGLWLLVSWLVG